MQVADEKVSAFSFAKCSAAGVVVSGKVDEFKVFIGFDEGIDEAESGLGRDV